MPLRFPWRRCTRKESVKCSSHRGTDELERAQKDQDHLQNELDCFCEDMATAAKEFSNCWAAQEAAIAETSSALREICEVIFVEVRKAWQRKCDLKEKASEAQEKVYSNEERSRRTSNEHDKAEELVNDGLGSLGQAVRAAAQATHSLTSKIPDSAKKKIKLFRDATELIKKWKHQRQVRQPVSKAPSEHG